MYPNPDSLAMFTAYIHYETVLLYLYNLARRKNNRIRLQHTTTRLRQRPCTTRYAYKQLPSDLHLRLQDFTDTD